MIQWMKLRVIYFAISIVMIAIATFGLYFWGLKLGVDFKGGTLFEYRFNKDISTEEVSKKLKESGINISTIQATGNDIYIFRFPTISPDEKEKVKSIIEESTGGEGESEELRFETVGPSIGPELIRKTVYAILIASGSILLWVAYQFKSLKYGVSAVLAMFHDTFILVGSFALLGHYLGVEIDFLFVTALLTTLSFSVHDTIIVYDRIRETYNKERDNDIVYLANKAVTETMVRSLNNSFTIIFMLLALILLGGTTVKWFAVALFIGTILGTYSSPFVAVPLLTVWDSLEKKIKRK